MMRRWKTLPESLDILLKNQERLSEEDSELVLSKLSTIEKKLDKITSNEIKDFTKAFLIGANQTLVEEHINYDINPEFDVTEIGEIHDILIDAYHENNYDIFSSLHQFLWYFSINISYPTFYSAWHSSPQNTETQRS